MGIYKSGRISAHGAIQGIEPLTLGVFVPAGFPLVIEFLEYITEFKEVFPRVLRFRFELLGAIGFLLFKEDQGV